MNWVRGLFRLWLVLSILWVGAVFLVMRPDQAIMTLSSPATEKIEIEKIKKAIETLEATPNRTPRQQAALDKGRSLVPQRERRRAVNDLTAFAAIGPGVSLGLLVIGAGLLWAIRGFRPS